MTEQLQGVCSDQGCDCFHKLHAMVVLASTLQVICKQHGERGISEKGSSTQGVACVALPRMRSRHGRNRSTWAQASDLPKRWLDHFMRLIRLDVFLKHCKAVSAPLHLWTVGVSKSVLRYTLGKPYAVARKSFKYTLISTARHCTRFLGLDARRTAHLIWACFQTMSARSPRLTGLQVPRLRTA